MTMMKESLWTEEMKECLAILEKERCRFIEANYAKLSCLLGVRYWDDQQGGDRDFWNCDEDRAIENPYEFSLSELSKLPFRSKQMVMFNTYTYAPLFRMDEADKRRLAFDAAMLIRLSEKQIISEDEMGYLINEHACFMDRWGKGRKDHG